MTTDVPGIRWGEDLERDCRELKRLESWGLYAQGHHDAHCAFCQKASNKNWCPCGHSAQWHHETRGCGYHGFGARRCDCTHSADGVVEWLVFHAVSNVLDDMRDALLQGGQSHQIRWKAAVEVLERHSREVS